MEQRGKDAPVLVPTKKTLSGVGYYLVLVRMGIRYMVGFLI